MQDEVADTKTFIKTDFMEHSYFQECVYALVHL